MNIEVIKAISLKDVIEQETGLRFKRRILQHCPFCNSGNHGHSNSDSAFSIKESGMKSFFYCFSCGRGGSILDFIKEYHEISLKEAIGYIEQKYLNLQNTISKWSRVITPSTKELPSINPDYIPMEWVNQSMKKYNNNLIS